MDPLPSFFLTLLLVSFLGIRFRIPPIFNLTGGALFLGILIGMPPDQLISVITTGLGRIFALFALIILSGAIIAAILEEQGDIQQIVHDIRNHSANPYTISGLSGYLLALPVACSVTAFIILSPVVKGLGNGEKTRTLLLYCVAIGSLISFGLVYPTPAVIPLVQSLAPDLSPALYDALALPLSILLLFCFLLLFRFWFGSCDKPESMAKGPDDSPQKTVSSSEKRNFRAYAPFIAILLAIPVGLSIGLSHGALIQVIMLAGAATAIMTAAPGIRAAGLQRGTKHAGVIIFDICGAGALAGVILASGFSETALGQITAIIPVLLVPFVLASLIQTAQGSRVVTAVLTAGILAGTQVAEVIHPVALIIMIAAGCFVFSFVTDPFFWIVSRTTGDDFAQVIRRYTIPLALCGAALYLVALGMQLIVSGG
ncbi:MAG TPA: GntP family permease [Methanoregulaceae archaeon]|nr:GntP family permease [Methanoregulaceae archaeon]HPW10216.1 GntP family permease [Methanoregulaceae archaeon]HQM55886.1 GntP family permease [Methanoregulaceae archaeon]